MLCCAVWLSEGARSLPLFPWSLPPSPSPAQLQWPRPALNDPDKGVLFRRWLAMWGPRMGPPTSTRPTARCCSPPTALWFSPTAVSGLGDGSGTAGGGFRQCWGGVRWRVQQAKWWKQCRQPLQARPKPAPVRIWRTTHLIVCPPLAGNSLHAQPAAGAEETAAAPSEQALRKRLQGAAAIKPKPKKIVVLGWKGHVRELIVSLGRQWGVWSLGRQGGGCTGGCGGWWEQED